MKQKEHMINGKEHHNHALSGDEEGIWYTLIFGSYILLVIIALALLYAAVTIVQHRPMHNDKIQPTPTFKSKKIAGSINHLNTRLK